MKISKLNNTITVLGLWHLGLVTSVGLSELGLKVIGFDPDKNKIAKLNKGTLPIFEPELDKYLAQNLKKGRLKFTNSFSEIFPAKIIYFTFDTPLNDKDEVDLSVIFATAQKLSSNIQDGTIVIISSQVPIGTTEKIEEILCSSGKKIDIAYIPENLQLGKAWERFFHPKFISIGTKKKDTYERILRLFTKIDCPKIWTDIRTAEMVKHAINSYLATSISFANELGNLSDKVGADFLQVANILKMDERIGPYARILPGLGFAGGTLARDLKILQSLGKMYNFKTNLIDAVLTVNGKQKKWVTDFIKRLFNNKLKGKVIGILGLTYTPQTSTLRRSLAIETINDLIKYKAMVKAYDPMASEEELRKCKGFRKAGSITDLAHSTDAIVLMTQWPEFLRLEWRQIKNLMRNSIIIDPYNFLTDLNLENLGFSYFGLGRGNIYE